MRKIIEIPLTLATVQAWGLPALEDVARGMGDYPEAICDFITMLFSKHETRIVVGFYRNEEAWNQGIQIPGFPPIELYLSRAEHVALAEQNQPFADLETAVREAVWSLMTTHPKMLAGPPPAPGDPDTRNNVFAAGTLVDLDAV